MLVRYGQLSIEEGWKNAMTSLSSKWQFSSVVETKFFSLKKKMLGSISRRWSQAVILRINKAVVLDNRMVGHAEVAIEQTRSRTEYQNSWNVTLRKNISIQDKLIAERRVTIISVSWIYHTDVDEVTLLAQRSTEKNLFADDSYFEM